MRLLILALSGLLGLSTGCVDHAARSSDDILICKQFINEAVMRMDDLKSGTFEPDDLTLAQLRNLTPSDPDWLDAEFLVLNAPWTYQAEEEKIVIVCGKSRVIKDKRVHSVAYSSGRTEWIELEKVAEMQLGDFSVLPKIRP